eukprot:CAMPEP_0113639492 /NCGR_PEP_ID=MMETSP0017_2-20120614/20716_1 /TAXON_ID=2856 /ORGANISM="Cylindrotheca closterium" /LENGTH=298 /DNA_ID=CAMNT_0000550705 /DNA_START=128 /DNA_END=1025 /DNA_ORIENTATION=+ /assembly_acc=CAM_ASM_000147
MSASAPNSSPEGYCKFAIPKKGRLYEKVVKMLKGAGIEFNRADRLDVAICKAGLPITLIFLPAKDIAMFVGKGDIDVGITGWDVVKESGVTVDRVMDLGFGKCKLSVQAPVVQKNHNVEALAGKRIATSFPETTKEFFKSIDEKKGTTTTISFISGSVEAACGLGLADAVVDLVETGTTMRAAGLEVVHEVLETEAMLIANPNSTHKDLVELIKKRIDGFITATKYCMVMYNISEELLPKAIEVSPGKRSPTITNLDAAGMKAVSSLVLKKEVSEKMDALHDIGATDILVLEMANSRM